MAVPTLVNGDFAIPSVSPGSFTLNPTDPGVGWSWDTGHAGNSCRVYGPTTNGWAGQSVGLVANNSASTECACYQTLTFDGSPIRLRLRARRITTHARMKVSVGSIVLIDETGTTGTWPDWHVFVWNLTPTAGSYQVRIAQRTFSGQNLGLADVVIEAATGKSFLLCLRPGLYGYLG